MLLSYSKKIKDCFKDQRGAMSVMTIIMILVAILVLYAVIGYVVDYNASVQADTDAHGLTKLFADLGEWFFVLIPVLAILGIGMARRRRR